MDNGQKTVLITGSSTGIGRATVIYFSRKGWNVAATMRHPELEKELDRLPGVRLFRLDVLDRHSVEDSIADALQAFGKIDVLVNNAGYAAIGPFEAAGYESIQRQVDTNLLGLMLVTRILIPHFRENGGGTIVNISSAGGRITFPFYSLYHATKWAVEGFSESLRYELKPLGIRIKLIEPGAIRTDFYSRSFDILEDENLKPSYPDAGSFVKLMQRYARLGASPEVAARKIFLASVSRSSKLRYPAGGGAGTMLFISKIIPFRWLAGLIPLLLKKKPTEDSFQRD
jgi:NAD(P)-dependent dehydrogenase (short-subunit alcohol dehydrogenase family)